MPSITSVRWVSLLMCAFALAAPAGAQLGSLTTVFSGNAGIQDGGNLFDIEVARPGGIWITGFDVNLGGLPPPGSCTIDVFVTPGGYLGKDSQPSAWTQVASAAAMPNFPDEPLRIDTADFFLPQGTHGLALYVAGNGPWYSIPPVAPTSVSNADVTLRFGIAKPLRFAGGSFGPRVWNGTLYYGAPPPPIVEYGVGKTTSLGVDCVPRIAATGVLSTAPQARCIVLGRRIPSHQPGLLLYSFQGRADLPFAGGRLLVSTPVRRSIPLNSGGTTSSFDCSGRFALDLSAFARGELGGNPAAGLALPGTVVNCQWWGRDPGFAGPNQTLLSDALELVVGA